MRNFRFDFLFRDVMQQLYPQLKVIIPVFGGIIIAIALFPLIGVILACCLARQMSKQRYEQVD